MIALLATAAMLAAAAQDDVPHVRLENVPLATLNIPDEIAPAILPYSDCQLASRGVRNGPPGPGQTVPPPEQLGANCSGERETARRQGENRLRDLGRGTPAERRAYVERVLAQVDRFAAAVPSSSPMPESRPDPSQADMSSVDVPYQAIPALTAYLDCMSDHFSDDERRGSTNLDDVRQANSDAIAACRGVRAQQLARALAEQTDNRLYGGPANARAAIREAFDRYDRDFQIVPAAPAADGAPKE